MARLGGRAGRSPATNGAFRPGQYHQYSGFGGDANLSAQILSPAYWRMPLHTLVCNGTSSEPPVKPASAPSRQQAYQSYQSTKPAAELWVGETAAAWDSGKLSLGRHCHSTLSLAVIGCHAFGVCAVV